MIISEVVTLGIYAFSMVFLPEYFGAFVFHFRPTVHFRSFFFLFSFSIFPFNSRRRSRFPCFRSIIRGLSAIWVESRGYCWDKRATSVDYQDDQESCRT